MSLQGVRSELAPLRPDKHRRGSSFEGTNMRHRRLILVTAMAIAITASGCVRDVKAGSSCRTTDFGDDGTHVLKCERGRWVRKATHQQVAEAVAAIIRANQSTTVPTAAPTTMATPTTTLPPQLLACAGGSGTVSISPGLTYTAATRIYAVDAGSRFTGCFGPGVGPISGDIVGVAVNFPSLSCGSTSALGTSLGEIRWSDGTQSALDVKLALTSQGTAELSLLVTSGRFAGAMAAAPVGVTVTAGNCTTGITAESFHIGQTIFSPI